MIAPRLLIALLFAALPVAAQTPGWIADGRTGCKVWNVNPQSSEAISWNGACPNGLAQGRGVLQWFKEGKPDGAYEGEYRDGKENGRGVYTSPNGSRYEGEWRDGKANGRGVHTSASGSRYEGEWHDDKRSGRGVVTGSRGSRYEGEWRDDKPNGVGTYTKADGTTYSGTWSNGCFRQGDRKAWIGVTAKDCGFE